MFENLVESTAHNRDARMRKGMFFLSTLLAYVVVLLAAGVFSIYAYKAQLDNEDFEQHFEMATIISNRQTKMLPATAQPLSPKFNRATNSVINLLQPRDAPLVHDARNSTEVPKGVHTIPSNHQVALPNGIINSSNVASIGEGINSLPSDFEGNSAGGKRLVVVDTKEEPPQLPAVKTPVPTKVPTVISVGVMTGKALHKPAPPYPMIAKAAKAQGTVTVQIVVDEVGKVVSAQATNGHPLLRQAAVTAAYQARFSPTLLSLQPVKVSGIIMYNFVLQ